MSFLSYWTQQLGLSNADLKSANGEMTPVAQHAPASIRADVAGGMTGITPLQLSAVFACSRVIAEGVAQVPCLFQKRSSTGGYEPATDHPLYDLLMHSPNSYMTSFEFREWTTFQKAVTGNAFVYVSRDSKGRPIELIPLPSGSVSVTNPSFGEVFYRLNVSGNPIYSQENIWHLKGPSWSGIQGLPLQAIAARAMGLAADLETFGSQLFKNGSRPSGVLSTDKPLTLEHKEEIAKAWNSQYAGVENAHKTAVLSDGLSFEGTQTTANDAQFIEARRYQTEEICRIMRVDPVMIGQAVNGASYNSIEQRFLAHMIHTLSPWYARFEQSAEKALLSPKEQREGYRVHLDSRGLMRGSATDRVAYYKGMREVGAMTQNEVREAEGLDRSTDPMADELIPAANIFGPAPGTPVDDAK